MNNEVVEQRREKIKKLYKEGLSHKGIAEKLGTSISTVGKDIIYLKEKGEIKEKRKRGRQMSQTEKEQLTKRREEVRRLHKKGFKQKDIAEMLGVSMSTVSKDIQTYEKISSGTTKKDIRRSKIVKLCKEYYGQPEILQKLKDYLGEYRAKFNEKTLEKEELETIRKLATITESFKDSVFYIKACVRFGKTREAIRFINDSLNNEKWTPEQKETMKEKARKVKRIEQLQTVIIELKRGKGVRQVSIDLGIPEAEVVKINRKLIQKSKKREEDDSLDEPKI